MELLDRGPSDFVETKCKNQTDSPRSDTRIRVVHDRRFEILNLARKEVGKRWEERTSKTSNDVVSATIAPKEDCLASTKVTTALPRNDDTPAEASNATPTPRDNNTATDGASKDVSSQSAFDTGNNIATATNTSNTAETAEVSNDITAVNSVLSTSPTAPLAPTTIFSTRNAAGVTTPELTLRMIVPNARLKPFLCRYTQSCWSGYNTEFELLHHYHSFHKICACARNEETGRKVPTQCGVCGKLFSCDGMLRIHEFNVKECIGKMYQAGHGYKDCGSVLITAAAMQRHEPRTQLSTNLLPAATLTSVIPPRLRGLLLGSPASSPEPTLPAAPEFVPTKPNISIEEWICRSCDTMFKNASDLKLHVQCLGCGVKFDTCKDLKFHLRCRLCDRQFSRGDNYHIHDCFCPYCETVFRMGTRNHLNGCKRKHCTECNLHCDTPRERKLHQMEVHGDFTGRLPCKHCSAGTYPDLPKLASHMRKRHDINLDSGVCETSTNASRKRRLCKDSNTNCLSSADSSLKLPVPTGDSASQSSPTNDLEPTPDKRPKLAPEKCADSLRLEGTVAGGSLEESAFPMLGEDLPDTEDKDPSDIAETVRKNPSDTTETVRKYPSDNAEMVRKNPIDIAETMRKNPSDNAGMSSSKSSFSTVSKCPGCGENFTVMAGENQIERETCPRCERVVSCNGIPENERGSEAKQTQPCREGSEVAFAGSSPQFRSSGVKYECDGCGHVFKCDSDRKLHLTCATCSTEYVNGWQYHAHRCRSYKCGGCALAFSSLRALNEHHTCQHCGRSFKSARKQFHEHVLQCCFKMPYKHKCDGCALLFQSLEDLNNHTICGRCGLSFASGKRFHEHEVRCRLCSCCYEVFTSMEAYHRHLQCPLCGVQFQTDRLRHKHQCLQRCTVCKLVFESSSDSWNHLKCSVCRRQFHEPHSFHKHKDEGCIGYWKCEGCAVSFQTAEERKLHLRCAGCGRPWIRGVNFHKHLESCKGRCAHHGTKASQCVHTGECWTSLSTPGRCSEEKNSNPGGEETNDKKTRRRSLPLNRAEMRASPGTKLKIATRNKQNSGKLGSVKGVGKNFTKAECGNKKSSTSEAFIERSLYGMKYLTIPIRRCDEDALTFVKLEPVSDIAIEAEQWLSVKQEVTDISTSVRIKTEVEEDSMLQNVYGDFFDQETTDTGIVGDEKEDKEKPSEAAGPMCPQCQQAFQTWSDVTRHAGSCRSRLKPQLC